MGALVVLLTNGWRPAAYATWFQRLLGVAIAGLAFPSLDAIRFEPAGEWWLRLIFIGLVLAGAALLFLIPPLKIWLVDALVIALALAGSLLPGWVLLVVAPVAREWLHISFRIGAGFWLSTLGFLFAAAYTAAALWWRRSTDS